MLASASKLDTLRERKGQQASEGERRRGGGAPRKRMVPKRAAKAGGVGGFKVVGRRVQVWWDGERQWFAGEIAVFNARTGRHSIKYDDGDEEVVDLRKQRLRWLTDGEGNVGSGGKAAAGEGGNGAGVVKRKRRKKKALFTKQRYLQKAAAMHNLSGFKEDKSHAEPVEEDEEEMEGAGGVDETCGAASSSGERKRRKRKPLFTKQKRIKTGSEDGGSPSVRRGLFGGRTVIKRKVLIKGNVTEVGEAKKASANR
jgi:hypothetical protein